MRGMSTAVAVSASAGPPRQRPGYWLLFRTAAVAQFAGGLCLFVLGALLSMTSLVGLNLSNLSLYAPWVIDGPWAFAASIGWAALVTALIGSIVRERVEARAGAPPSRVLTMASVAIGGYGPWLLATTSGARLALCLLLMPAVLRLIAFDRSGQPRQLPHGIELSRRVLAMGLVCGAAAFVGPYAVLHPLRTYGSGGSAGDYTNDGVLYHVRPGQTVQAEAGIQVGTFPITVTGVRLIGVPKEIRIVRVALGVSPPLLHPAPPAHLRARVAARHGLWIGYAIALTRCPSRQAAITQIRVSYRELGLSLTQTVSLNGSNTILSCQ